MTDKKKTIKEKKHCENCWVEEDGFGSCNLEDCECHKVKMPK